VCQLRESNKRERQSYVQQALLCLDMVDENLEDGREDCVRGVARVFMNDDFKDSGNVMAKRFRLEAFK
jgi:hypothetical protein